MFQTLLLVYLLEPSCNFGIFIKRQKLTQASQKPLASFCMVTMIVSLVCVHTCVCAWLKPSMAPLLYELIYSRALSITSELVMNTKSVTFTILIPYCFSLEHKQLAAKFTSSMQPFYAGRFSSLTSIALRFLNPSDSLPFGGSLSLIHVGGL